MGNKYPPRAVGETTMVNFTVEVPTGSKTNNSKNYVKCEAWGDQAKIVDEMSQGDVVFVSGSVRTGSYEKDGVKVYTQNIRAQNVAKFDMSGGKSGGVRQAVAQAPKPAPAPAPVEEQESYEEVVPF